MKTNPLFALCYSPCRGLLKSDWEELEDMTRGAIPDKWSMRILWGCAIGSAVGLYMVAVERQMQNRAKMLAEALEAESREAE
ncbi:hypothetical protein V2J09_023695 [Rumex salicifolius]